MSAFDPKQKSTFSSRFMSWLLVLRFRASASCTKILGSIEQERTMSRHLTVVLVLLSFSQSAFGQWSDKQTEIWNVIQSTWSEETEESGKWPTKFATPDYQSWGQDEALPQMLETLDRTLKYWNKHSKLKFYRLVPASITLNEDVAVVNYYATEYRETTEGSRSRSVTAITETLVFRDGRWRFLASSTWTPKLN